MTSRPFPFELSADELAVLKDFIESCHQASRSTSHIKDEGFLRLAAADDGQLRIAAVSSESGVQPEAKTLAVLERLVAVFMAQLDARFPIDAEYVRTKSQRLQWNALSYKAAAGATDESATIPGVPFHSDRVPTRIILNILVTAAATGGELEVLDLTTSERWQLNTPGWGVVFDDRQCLHRVSDMRGHRQSLTLRVW